MTTISRRPSGATFLVIATVLAGLLGAVVLVARPFAEESTPGGAEAKPTLPQSKPSIPLRPANLSRPSTLQQPTSPLERAGTPGAPNPGPGLDPGPTGAGWNGSSGDPSRLEHCLVTAIDAIQVPAEEAGRIVSLKVREGQQVEAGQLLARLDDTQIKKAQEVADAKYRAAVKEAANEVSVQYAEAAWTVAWYDYARTMEANAKQANTFTPAEVQLKAHEVTKGQLQTKQAQHELGVAQIKVDVQKAEAEAAALDVERRQIKCPVSGHVEKRHKGEGEWVKPGDPVYQVIRMDRLYVEGFVDASRLSPIDVDGRKVRFTFRLSNGKQASVDGQITVVSGKIEQGPTFLVKAEVENRRENGYWLLRPGQVGQMEIQLK